MGINRGSFSSVVRNTFASLFLFSILFQLSFFNYLIQLKEYRMKMIILIGLLLSVITAESKSIQREKAAGNAEKRARQMDQGPASFEADENEESRRSASLRRCVRPSFGTFGDAVYPALFQMHHRHNTVEH